MRHLHLLHLTAKAIIASGGDLTRAAQIMGVSEEVLRRRATRPAKVANKVCRYVMGADVPEEIVGQDAMAAAIGASRVWIVRHMTGDDPIPAKHTLRGLVVKRSRFDLWLRRVGKDANPEESLGVIRGRPAIAKALGISVPSLKNYMRSTAPYGRCPVYRTGGVSWAYREALVDWLDSQRMGIVVARLLRGTAKINGQAGEDEDEETLEG